MIFFCYCSLHCEVKRRWLSWWNRWDWVWNGWLWIWREPHTNILIDFCCSQLTNFRQLLELQEYNCSMIAHRLNILSYCWCFFLPSTWYPITFHCRALAHATKTMLKESPRDFIKRQINDHLQVIITSICYLECIIADDNQQMDWLQQQTTEMISQSNQILKTNKKKLQHKLSRARSSQLRFACDNKFESCRKSCSCSVRYVQAQEKQKEKLFIYYSWMRAIIAFAPLLF